MTRDPRAIPDPPRQTPPPRAMGLFGTIYWAVVLAHLTIGLIAIVVIESWPSD